MPGPGKPFPKGQSGNPSGRPKLPEEVRDRARSLSIEALETLAAIMKDTEAPPSARVAAANVILDRGYGKPPQSLDVTPRRLFDEMSDAELAETLAAVRQALADGAGEAVGEDAADSGGEGRPSPVRGVH